jgi:hypothetical protein
LILDFEIYLETHFVASWHRCMVLALTLRFEDYELCSSKVSNCIPISRFTSRNASNILPKALNMGCDINVQEVLVGGVHQLRLIGICIDT